MRRTTTLPPDPNTPPSAESLRVAELTKLFEKALGVLKSTIDEEYKIDIAAKIIGNLVEVNDKPISEAAL